MTITVNVKECLADLEEKYFKVVKLIKEDSKSDPKDNPYLSKNAAKDILITMKATIENLLKKQTLDVPVSNKLTAMLGVIHIYIGTIFLEIVDLTTSEKHFQKSLNLIEPNRDKPEYISATINAYNQMGILWSNKEPTKSKIFLDKAVELYNNHKHYMEAPLSTDALFMVDNHSRDLNEESRKFEHLHTFTLYFLAQIYGTGELKDPLKSAVYCHNTLKRQLVYNYYEPIDWALNAATLSQFFMEQDGFKQARHHLSASSYILDKYKIELDQLPKDEVYEAKMEEFNHRSADVARCWAKYGSLLLSKSKERLLGEVEKLSPDLSNLKMNESSTVSSDDLQDLYFPSLDLVDYESKITDRLILTLPEAREIFLNGQNWLQKAQSYYTLENLASDHIEIAIDQSQLYLNLLFFDDCTENQAKLHKRRIDLLENIVEKVNAKYYLQYCRQMWFELGQTYLDILDIKLEKQRESKSRPTPQALSKINNLIGRGLLHYNSFINSFDDKTKINESFLRPYSRSLFYIAVLNGKYITFDKRVKLRNIEESLKFYKEVIDFANKNEAVKDMIPTELSICEEMRQLLPVQIEMTKAEVAKLNS